MFENSNGTIEQNIENPQTLNHLAYAAWSIQQGQGQITTPDMVKWVNQRTGQNFTIRQMRGFRERVESTLQEMGENATQQQIEQWKTEATTIPNPLLHPNGRKNINGNGGTLINGDETLTERLQGEKNTGNLTNTYDIDPTTGEGEFELEITDEMTEKLRLRTLLSQGNLVDEDGEYLIDNNQLKQMVEIYGQPNYEDVPKTKTEFLKLLNLNEEDYEIGSFNLSRGTTWVRDYPSENAYSRSVNRVSGKLIPVKRIQELAVSQAPPMNVVVRTAPVESVPARKAGKRVIVVTPDPQIGYRRMLHSGKVVTSHCEKAINVTSQIIRELKPDVSFNLGDWLDLPELGRWSQEAGMSLTLQPSLNRGAQVARELELDYILEGNHDQRLLKALMEHNMALFGVTKAEVKEDGYAKQESQISISELLRLDEIGCEFIEGYPSNTLRLHPRLIAIHGDVINSSGSTAAKLLAKEKSRDCILYGHIHNTEFHSVSGGRDAYSAVTRWAYTPGSLSRLDGGTPSMKGSFKSDGSPSRTFENWQNGFGVILVDDNDPDATPVHEHVTIVDGVAYFRGNEYVWSEEEVRENLSWLPEHGINQVDIGGGIEI